MASSDLDPAAAASTESAEEADAAPDLTAAAVEVIPPEIVAQSLSQYLRASLARVRSGDAGLLPVAVALVAVLVVFTIISPNHVFLSARNLVNLFDQSAVFIVLAMGEGFVLLLGEIDLSIGYVAAIGGIVTANLVQPNTNWPWWAAMIAGVLACAVIGAIQGTIITRLRMPAFVVTLAGYLIWFGVMIIILGAGGGVGITSALLPNQQAIYGIVYSYIDPTVAWIGLVVLVGVLGAAMWQRDTSRRRSGLVAPPMGLTLAKIASIALAGIAVVAICNVNRGSFLPIVGVPWVVPLVLVALGIWTVLLERTQFGRHVYAVGGNPEAARRAGINVARVRTLGFVLCSATAGLAGIIYCSQLGGMNTNINGGQLVLYAVAAAVIGGTSLFGGRGRAIHGLLGGLVIGAIYNGLYLLGLPIQWQLIITGLVLLAAVSVDSLSRRAAGSSFARV
ncbi:MAG: ABC transporter permease [Chloroflexota bacterium]|nr:ABC transporter permease [Chloroflexota bacterium]